MATTIPNTASRLLQNELFARDDRLDKCSASRMLCLKRRATASNGLVLSSDTGMLNAYGQEVFLDLESRLD